MNISKNPKISIVLPVYNAARYLRECLDSILNQSFTDFEIIAIDDCSTDASLYILKEYAQKDKRIKIFSNNKNLGVSRTANKAISLTSADYIARMDADDVMYKDRLKLQYAFLSKNSEYILVGGQVRIVDQNGEIIRYKSFPTEHEEMYEMLYIAMPVQQPTIMVNRTKLPEDFVWYEDGMNTAEEVELIFKLTNYGKLKNIDKILNDYRDHDNSLSRQNPKDTFRLTYIARRKGVIVHGYKPSKLHLITVEIQRLIITILPNQFIYPVYFRLRKVMMLLNSIKINAQSIFNKFNFYIK